MSSKGRQIAKTIGKSIKKKFDVDFFQFPFGYDDQQKDLSFLPQGSPTFAGQKVSKMQSSPRSPRKSTSLSTITATEASEPTTIVDHDEIIALTHDVKKFSDSLARLKALFTEGIDEEEDARVIIHESLGEVLSVLNPVMQRYPALQSPDIFTAARGLITMIKDHNYEDDVTSSKLQLFCEAIDQLALAFSSSVSEYLMGDMGPQFVLDFKTKSMNNIADEGEGMEESEGAALSPEELDSLLVGLESGLSLALQRAKVWSKYLHDIICYMEKKAQIEYDYAKNLGRLAHSVQNSLKKEGFLPLQSVYCTALSHDEEFVGNLQSTQSLLQRFIEPLSTRRAEHDKVYKYVKEAWHRECRKMTDSVTNLRKSQALYHSRQQDHERARDLALKAEGDKLEKKKKAEEETLHKTAEAETTYKACVAEANYRQQELFKIKGDLLGKLRDQIQLCDQVIKDVTVEYFHMYQSIVSPLPLQCQTLSESSKTYVPGSQYAEYVRRLPPTSHTVRPENFVFEPYVHGLKPSPDDSRKASVHSNGSVSDHAHSPDGSPIASPRRDKYRIPVKAWGQTHQGMHSDTDSASCSSKSHDSSPSGSPQGAVRRHLVTSQSLDELTEEDLIAAAAAAAAFNGKEKSKKSKRGTAGAGRDNPTEIPGLMLHTRRRSNTTFGIDFQEQVDIFHTKVPPIVSMCLAEIETRGLMIKGIYRVSGVKSKVEHLCQQFDFNPESVNLDEVHPNIISNVLKLYLRQLPEPLLTFRLYPEFIHAAKDNMSGQLVGEELTQCLYRIAKHLPSSNFRTSAVLMHHLHRVAAHSELNQMSASNLGIVFGPTLLRPLEGSASLASLVDTPHQTHAIELLISHAHLVFGPSEDFQVAPSQTPIETLDQALADVIIPGKSQVAEAGMPAKTKSLTIESDDSSLSVFESSTSPSSTPNSATQPTPSEYVLPGSADFEQIDLLSLNGLDLDSVEVRSDDDEELPEILLPDKSKPQAEALSVALTPQSISVPGAPIGLPMMDDPNLLTVSSKTAVPKSASTPAVSKESVGSMPNSLSAPTAMSNSELNPSGETGLAQDAEESGGVRFLSKKGRLHESHSTGDLLESSTSREDDEGEKYASDLLTGKKKPHSQKLENIKFLTRAPSVDEVTNIMDELIIRSGGISPLPSPAQGSSPQSFFSPMASPKFFDSKSQPPKTEVEKSSEAPATSPSSFEVWVPQSSKEDVEKYKEDEVAVEVEVAELSSSRSKVASSRKSILEEIPIATLSKPRRHGTSDGGSGDGQEDEQVPPITIPASPTIKRREMTSKIPSSPRSTRSSDLVKAAVEKIDVKMENGRADRFRKEQRKLVSAIKLDSKRSSSRPGSSSDDLPNPGSEDDAPLQGTVGGVLTGGCAMSSQGVVSMEEMMESFKKDETEFTRDKTVVKTEGRMSRSVLHEEKPKSVSGRQTSSGKIQSKTTVSSSAMRLSSSSSTSVRTDQSGVGRTKGDSSSGSASPSKIGSGGKGRVMAAPASSISRKAGGASSSTPSPSSIKTSSSSRLGLDKTSAASSPTTPKKDQPTSSYQSPKTSSKSSVTRAAVGKTSSSKSSLSKAAEAQSTSSIKESGRTDSSSPTKTSSESPSISTTPRLRHRSGDTPMQSPSPASSPGRPARSVKKLAYSGSPSPSSQRSTTSSISSTLSAKTKPTQLPTATSSSPVPEMSSAQTTTTASSSSSSSPTSATTATRKISTDRTPRFV